MSFFGFLRLKTLSTVPFTDQALHLFGLSAFAVSQPLYALLGKNATFFTARHTEPLELLLMVLLLTLGIPAIGCLLIALARLVRGGPAVYFALASLLLALILLPLLKGWLLYVPGFWMSLTALGSGAILMAVILNFEMLRTYLRWLSVITLAFPLLFLFFSSAGGILFPRDYLENSQAIGSKTPVVMIILDELPTISLLDENHRIDTLRYPHFSALAREGTWYRQATTVADKTQYAVPAILSGLYPREKHSPTVKNYPHNLFTLLGGSYALNVSESVTHLCPPGLCRAEDSRSVSGSHSLAQRFGSLFSDLAIIYQHIVLPLDWTDHLPGITESWGNFAQRNEEKPARTKDRAFRDFLQRIARHQDDHPERPALHFIHIELPHTPWIYLPTGQTYHPFETVQTDGFRIPETDKIWLNDWAATQGYQRHLLQLGYTDRLLGELLDTLKASGLYDQALIILTADHGISFQSGASSRFVEDTTHGYVEEILPVPLLIKYPHQKNGDISDLPVETSDIFPTLMDVLEAKPTWSVDGLSLVDARAQNRIAARTYRNFFTEEEEHLQFPNAFFGKQDARLQAKFRLFGSRQTGSRGLYGIGPYPGLIGRNIHTLSPGFDPDLTVQFMGSQMFEEVDPASDFIPARVKGKVLSRTQRFPGETMDLVLAMNDRVVAGTRTLPGRGQPAFSFMVPARFFTRGKNSLDVYRVSRQQGKVTLSRLPDQEAISYHLDLKARQVVSSRNEHFPIHPGAIVGEINAKHNPKGKYAHFAIFEGWAVDSRNRQIPNKLLIFSPQGKLIQTATFIYPNSEVALDYGKELENAGCRLYLPLNQLGEGTRPRELRFYALSKRGFVSELPLVD